MSIPRDFINGSQIQVLFENVSVASPAIVPMLNFLFKFIITVPSSQNVSVLLTGMGGVVRIIDKSNKDNNKNKYYIGTLLGQYVYFELSQGPYTFQLSVELDPYKLKRIEEIRNGGDVDLSFDLYLEAEPVGQPQKKRLVIIPLVPAKIYKSEWVEKILPQLGYKDVFLVEIPKIKDEGFAKVAEYMESAWKEYMSGKYDITLNYCRKALEALKNKMKELDLTRTHTIIKDNNEVKEEIIDWKKLNLGDNIADILDSMFRKLYGFTTPGDHAGKAINKEDGDFALLVTNAIVSYAIEKVKSIEKLGNDA